MHDYEVKISGTRLWSVSTKKQPGSRYGIRIKFIFTVNKFKL